MASIFDVQEPTPEEARNVLWFFGDRELGWEPGGFTEGLISAACRADSGNRARLALGFPGLIAGVVIAKDHEDGLDVLRRIARG